MCARSVVHVESSRAQRRETERGRKPAKPHVVSRSIKKLFYTSARREHGRLRQRPLVLRLAQAQAQRGGNVSAAASVANGPGLTNARVHFTSAFIVQARDVYGNDLEDHVWDLDAYLSAPAPPASDRAGQSSDGAIISVEKGFWRAPCPGGGGLALRRQVRRLHVGPRQGPRQGARLVTQMAFVGGRFSSFRWRFSLLASRFSLLASRFLALASRVRFAVRVLGVYFRVPICALMWCVCFCVLLYTLLLLQSPGPGRGARARGTVANCVACGV